MTLRRVLPVSAMWAALACSGSGPTSLGAGLSLCGSGKAGASTTSIDVCNNFFSPKVDTVGVNATVTWTWAASPSNLHNVSWDSGPVLPPRSGAPTTSGQYSFTFMAAGTYTYHCEVHVGIGMVGTVVVR